MNTTTRTLDAGPLDATRRGYLADLYLPSIARQWCAANRLHDLAMRVKPGPDQQAVIEGYSAVTVNLNDTIRSAANVGGLPLIWDGSSAFQGGAV